MTIAQLSFAVLIVFLVVLCINEHLLSIVDWIKRRRL